MIVEKKLSNNNRNTNMNKTSNPKDCPDMVKALWDLHIYATEQAKVAVNIQSKFAREYKCIVLDRLRPNIAGLIGSEDVF